ncbi:FMN-dependent NADH-azoreductase 2 [Bradyrhizobium oligotrophicum S58]|uniref:FMN dependent NADH:quinone oxidoreductase n=1 Tax=Bradyrhizobium oligotrophicum S58 TaxID=1245469 RepID=M4Z6Q5_9BRAD|nr:FMN-dependent NADH-azoreductase [Bradyrhizobium oligotrophicum]BAM89233.1 FMN-dependent NADH-azoreductase 2 [Bradyrhizobium oligotrophicum S58]
MTQLLHIDSSVLGPNSVSRQVSAAIVGRFRQVTPGLEVTYRDVAAEPLSHLSGTHVAIAYGAPVEDPTVKAEVAAGQAALEEFLAADIVVIGAPMYNFSIPSQLKAWIDRIAVRGKTFSYGPNGPQGLAGGKRVIIAVSRGGHYGADTPMATFEHLETYLRSVFSFIGVTDLEFIAADGVQIGAEQREQALANALQTAGGLAA